MFLRIQNDSLELPATDRDYLTIKRGDKRVFLDGAPVTYYHGAPLFEVYSIWGPLFDKATAKYPIQEMHCMLSSTESYLKPGVKYAVSDENVALRFSLSDISKEFGPNWWLRTKMIDGTLTPWYHCGTYNSDVQGGLTMLVVNSATRLVTDFDLVNTLYRHLAVSPESIHSAVEQRCELIRQRQQELLAQREK